MNDNVRREIERIARDANMSPSSLLFDVSMCVDNDATDNVRRMFAANYDHVSDSMLDEMIDELDELDD